MIEKLYNTVLKTGFAAAIGVASLAMTTNGALSADWTLSGDDSRVAFGSIKKDKIGEVHHFSSLSGSVKADGTISLEIDLTSVETFIDIRNARFLEHIFAANAPQAILSGKINMSELENLKAGDTTEVDLEGKLTFNAAEVPVEATLFVARLAENKVMVTTDEMIMLSTADLGIDAGVDILQKLAKLPSITRVTPVTARMVFTK